MVKLFKSRLSNPFVLSTVILCFLLYSGLIKPSARNLFCPTLSGEKINYIEGYVCSNPVKNKKKGIYSFLLSTSACGETINESNVRASCKGVVSVSLSEKYVEALFPGKLYSLSKESILVEKGEKLKLYGKYFSESNYFFTKHAEYSGYKNTFAGKISHLRALCRLKLRRLLYSWGNAGALILSLLSGSRDSLNEEVGNCFLLAGLSHLLALSGMHLSFFSNLFDYIGKKILGKRASFFTKLFGIIFFVWFAGFSPSLFRAFVMQLLILFASRCFLLQIDSFCVLCTAFIIHLVLLPQDYKTAAFMLSYGALAGIMLLTPVSKKLLQGRVPNFINNPLAASFSAQVFTSPISAVLFKMLNPIGIISSVVVSPLISVFLTLSIFGILFSILFPFLSSYFYSIINTLYTLIVYLVSLFSKCPAIKFSF